MSDPRAILFDFGGVVLSSPLDGLRAYEAEVGLSPGFVQRVNLQNPDTNAWACMERGELDEATFYARFEAEAKALGGRLDARELFRRVTGSIRPEMVEALRTLRRRYVTVCVTNNMALGLGTAMAATPDHALAIAEVMGLFHHVVESCRIGARKPERAFFEHACAVSGMSPAACVFLDDLGTNLKTARAMGMTTIKVADPAQALADLESVLGHPIRP